MANLLFEITTYDIPYDLQTQAEEDIRKLFFTSLQSLEVKFDQIFCFSTSRRIVIYIINIDTVIKSKTITKKGPPANCSTAVLSKFLLGNNITLDLCYKEHTKKGDFYFANIITKELKLKDVLSKIIVKEILSKVTFRRSMFWNETKVKWARPITNLILCIGEDFIDLEFAGVKSSNKIQGHMFLCNDCKEISRAEDYFKEITNAKVVLLIEDARYDIIFDYVEFGHPELYPLKDSRKDIICEKIASFAGKLNILPNLTNELLNELVYLAEYPVVLFGKIPTKYLGLPKELLINTMTKNQRYITFLNNDGSISEHFAIVSNLTTPDEGATIIEGNQKVLNARLEDALFFYEMDIKEDWSTKKEELKKITFFEDLGSMFDKQERLKELAKKIFPDHYSVSEEFQFLPDDRLYKVCDFCKVDLTSKVVAEFPDLQGTMGYYYAKLKNSFSEEEALAIKEQYMPLSSSSELPESKLGVKLAILDKLDTLISFFKIGKIPTSSRDPFALRRAVLGIIRICIKHKININLSKFLPRNLLDFFIERLVIFLNCKDNVRKNSFFHTFGNIDKSIILAVIDKDNFDIFEIYNKSIPLSQALHHKKSILDIYKRINNILQNRTLSNKSMSIIEINRDLLQNSDENQLFYKILDTLVAYSKLSNKASYIKLTNNVKFNTNELVSKIVTPEQYENFLGDILDLARIIDSYLNNELIINPEFPELTNNRIALLTLAIYLFRYIGNLDILV